jgi:hypothetical protein
MNFANYRDHSIPLFYDCKILPMSFLYFYNTACFMHDIVNGKSPLHITTLFTNVCDVHTVITQEWQLVKICINPELDLIKLQNHYQQWV